MPRKTAALYLRSSKDRHDTSIDAQRRELVALAAGKGLAIVREFDDAVESGKDTQRPGFQAMLLELKSAGRSWDWLLIYDTSRLARRRDIAAVFRRECQKVGVQILFAKVPETDPISAVILESVMEAMDEVHSLMSREKGIAGMAENVRQGWRAGGRAPAGYVLEHIPTGAIREGAPVLKSRLAPGPDAQQISAYLKGRAAGRGRADMARECGITRNGLNDIEWNALLYAGHTVWNMRLPREQGSRRRPREEWIIQRDTHPALITEAEAEAILAWLNQSMQTRRTPAVYLLTSLLRTPTGERWHGNGGHYRHGKKNISARRLEESIIRQLTADLQADDFVQALTAEVRKLMDGGSAPDTSGLRRELTDLGRKIEKLTGMLADVEEPRPLLSQIDAFERRRQEIEGQIEQAAREARRIRTLRQVTESDVRQMLSGMAERLDSLDREALKDYLGVVFDRIELDPTNLSCCVHYRFSLETGVNLASPREHEIIPMIIFTRRVRIVQRKFAA